MHEQALVPPKRTDEITMTTRAAQPHCNRTTPKRRAWTGSSASIMIIVLTTEVTLSISFGWYLIERGTSLAETPKKHSMIPRLETWRID